MKKLTNNFGSKKLLLTILLCLQMFSTNNFIYGFDYMKKDVKVRPVKLKVIDKETKQPLSGIKVIYILRSFIRKNKILFGLLPRPEPRDDKTIEIYKEYTTDDKGELFLEEKILKLKKKENIFDETIFINLDLSPKMIEELSISDKSRKIGYIILNKIFLTKEHYVNPLKEYKGHIIVSEPWKKQFPNNADTAGYLQWNWNSFENDKEEFLIELEPSMKEGS